MININLALSGLDKKDAAGYLALLELGEATMSQLVRKSRLKRTTLYHVIETLKARGLASTTRKGKKTYYVAEDPRKLLEQADDNRRNLERMLPELLSVTHGSAAKPKVRYFEGADGIKEVYKDILRFPDQKMQAWLGGTIINTVDKTFIEDYYIPKRIEKKIWAEVIASDTPAGRTFKSKDITSLRRTRLLDPKRFPLSIEINLYGSDRIGFMSTEDQLGLIIESKAIADTLRSIFAAQWESLEERR